MSGLLLLLFQYEIKKQFFSDTSPDRDIEKWTSKEHNKWKVWNNE